MVLKIFSRKLYIPNITAPHMNTATCCVFGSVIRGTLSAKLIVANANTASGLMKMVRIAPCTLVELVLMLDLGSGFCARGLTYSSHDLAFQAKLVLETGCEIHNATFAIS